MRKLAVYLTATLFVIAILALAVAGCGEAQGAAQQGPTTPEGILSQAMTSATPVDNATGQFDISLAATGDQTKMPAAAKALLSQPITVTGTFSGSKDPMAMDLQLTAALAGQNLPLGMKMTGGKAWVQFMGQWYDMPAELTTTMSTATTLSQTTKDSLLQTLKTAGVDPSTWITGLTLAGEDDLGGTKAYHLSGNLDITKMAADIMKLAQSPDLQKMLPAIGGTEGTTGSSITLPATTDLQTMQKELTSMFQTFTVDMWITKDGYQFRQAAINAKIVPPAGQDSQGISDITLKMTVSMAPAASPVAVTPPADAKPFSELQTTLSGFEKLFSGLFGGSGASPSTGDAGSSTTNTTAAPTTITTAQ